MDYGFLDFVASLSLACNQQPTAVVFKMVSIPSLKLFTFVYTWYSLVGLSQSFQCSWSGSVTTSSASSTRIRTLLHSKRNNGNDGIEEIRSKAEQLREEVNQFERAKESQALKEQRSREEIATKKMNERMRYAVEVPILKSDGSEVMETVDFPPRMKSIGKKSIVLAVQATLPLGIILGESDKITGMTAVDEVAVGSNGDLAGVKVGDLLRGCTACQVTMEMPTWQLMAGGIGRPKTTRMMYSADGRPFEEIMEAVGSNRLDPSERAAWLVLERAD